MAEFDRIVRKVRPDQWAAPTPCTDWTVHDLANHLVNEQRWAPELLAGATVEEVGNRFHGDLLSADPVTAWASASAAARAAWTKPGALDRRVHVSWGMIDAVDYGWQMTTDLAVHSWDLATAIGEPIGLSTELWSTLLERVEPEVDHWQGANVFGPPVPVSADADEQTRLVALLGRDTSAWAK